VEASASGDLAENKKPAKPSTLTESQNGRDWKGHPCRSRVTYSKLHSTLSRWVLNISREGESTTSLGSLFQCSVTLRGKFFLIFS